MYKIWTFILYFYYSSNISASGVIHIYINETIFKMLYDDDEFVT